MVALGRVATRTANVSFGGPLVERREQRADTLASVLDSAVTVVVGSAVVLLVMKDLGWDIAPLLTSVGIVGVALAFGAQSLVKDVLSGIFMLLEDQYGIGDVIDLATTTGTVESVGLRVTRVRDSDGTLWFYRNGEIARVGNQSQGWSRAVVDVRLAAAADLRRTRELLVETGARVAADPEYRDLTVGEPTVTFVDDPTTSGAQLRLTVKTAPGEQSEVATELRRRVRLALAEAGVPLAS
jgi:small conductance mechanosensitive channel